MGSPNVKLMDGKGETFFEGTEKEFHNAVSAVTKGMHLTKIKTAIPKLEAACNHKDEAATDFKEAIQVAAIECGVIPGVLSQYIKAVCNDTVRKKAQSAQQLSLLFDELGE